MIKKCTLSLKKKYKYIYDKVEKKYLKMIKNIILL